MKTELEKLTQKISFTRAEAYELMLRIGKGEINEAQMAALLMAYNMNPITLEELEGFRDALMELCMQVDLSAFNPMDVCGTGGDGKNTFNISTLSAFVLAGAGVPIAKHGNHGVSGICGSSTVLESLGIQFSNKEEQLKRQIEKANICFLHAPLFHPALRNVSEVRKKLGVKTFFNMLGPLINPCNPKRQSTGVYNLQTARIYTYFLQQLKRDFVIVHSLDGYDEISLTDTFKFYTAQSEGVGSPGFFGLKNLEAIELSGGSTIEESAKIFMNVLSDTSTMAQKSVVCANAAMALRAVYPEINTKDAFSIALESLESKRALQCFRTLQKN